QLLANRGSVDSAAGRDRERRDFALGRLVENETFGGGFSGDARNTENAAAGFGAGNEIGFIVERKHADVGFIAGVEKFALAVRTDGKDLAFVASGDVERAVRAEREIPDV